MKTIDGLISAVTELIKTPDSRSAVMRVCDYIHDEPNWLASYDEGGECWLYLRPDQHEETTYLDAADNKIAPPDGSQPTLNLNERRYIDERWYAVLVLVQWDCIGRRYEKFNPEWISEVIAIERVRNTRCDEVIFKAGAVSVIK